MPANEIAYSLDQILIENGIAKNSQINNLVSDELREIIGTRPVWIVRNGITLFFIIIIALFVGAGFISYPDLIIAPVKLTGNNLPKPVLAKADGRLVTLMADTSQPVKIGTPLAIIQSTVNHQQALAIEQWLLIEEKKMASDKFEIAAVPDGNEVGVLQKNYQDIVLAINQWKQFYGEGYFVKKENNIVKDLQIIEAGKKNTLQQKEMMQADKRLQEVEYKAYEKLEKDKVIAPLELNQQKSKLLSKEQMMVQADASLLNASANYANKQKELLEITKAKADAKQVLQTAFLNMKAALADWKDKYVISATENGRLQILVSIQENITIKAGQDIFYIIPAQPDYHAEVIASQQNFGKIAKGQKVYIKLNSYPFQQYGSIKGLVAELPELTIKDTAYLLRVNLPDGLKTTYGTNLFFKNNLTGKAEIITEEMSLAERLLYQLRALVNKR